MKGIEELCLQLTDEERELHKELIDECTLREEQITQNFIDTKHSLNRLVEIGNEIVKDIETIKIAHARINRFVNSFPPKNHGPEEAATISENKSVH